jgi:hypothetical protein
MTHAAKKRVARFCRMMGAIAIAVLAIYGTWRAHDRVALRTWNFADPFPPDTEIEVENAGQHRIVVHIFRFGARSEQFEQQMLSEDEVKDKIDFRNTFRVVRPQPHYREEVEITYTDLQTHADYRATFIADRRPREQCKFWLVIERDRSRLSDCRRTDREDFGD